MPDQTYPFESYIQLNNVSFSGVEGGLEVNSTGPTSLETTPTMT